MPAWLRPYREYLLALVCVVATAACAFLVSRFSVRASVFAAVVGVLLIIVALVISGLNQRLRQQEQVAREMASTAENERLRSSLLSAVSHDLKTPLATIIAAGTTLVGRRAVLDGAAADDLAASIVGEAERLSRLISNLLSVLRLDTPEIELRRTPEAIEEIVAAAVERSNARLGAQRVLVELDPDLPLVLAEPLLLEQVLTNLLENARRHAGPDVTVRVRAQAGGDAITVCVEDDGPGIPDDERDKVFERFYRGRHAGGRDGGVGLGLTICRAIVRAHGGRIAVLPRAGGGTLVEFSVPLSDAGTTAPGVLKDGGVGS
jgi:two-component system, OmpR family, sensor histidine kinase KdpD